MPDSYMRARIGEGGRLVLPAAFRKALGLREGDPVTLQLKGDEIRIYSLDTAIKRIQKLAARYTPPGRSLSEELIAERRLEAERE